MSGEQRELTFRFLAEPTDVNYGGKVHGGVVMKWIDQVGYAAAVGWSGRYSVTVAVGGIRFVAPIRTSDLVTVTAKLGEKTVFLVEVGQAGIFRVMNVPNEQIEPLIAVACPNILFPYARELVANLVGRGTFPPLNLAPVNFDALFAAYVQQRAAQQQPVQA